MSSYLPTYESGELAKRSQKAHKLLASCTLCPRKCKVNRLKGQLGFCRTGAKAKIYSFLAHHGEEPPVSGTQGSGTIFFANCTLACVYCQNYEFSQQNPAQKTAGEGPKEVEEAQLAQIMLDLQALGCHNINFVSPTHVMPQILASLMLAIPKGLKIPLVYNTSGYEQPEILKLLDGIIDIYLPDMRYADAKVSLEYSAAKDYPKYNQAAILEMYRQVGLPQFDSQDIIQKGLIIRHLVLPNNISGTQQIMEFIKDKVSDQAYISLMSQYHPYYQAAKFPKLNRRITQEEYEQAQQTAQDLGLENGWSQEAGGLENLAGVHIKPKNVNN